MSAPLRTTSPTMSSVELVNVINDDREPGSAILLHKNFLAKIERHPGIDSAEFLAQYKDGSGRTLKCYYLPKRECELMVMSESLVVQTKVLDRLIAVEQIASALPNFLDPAAAARAWADEVDAKHIAVAKVAQLQNQIAQQAPAVAGLDRIANAAGAICISDAAKVLQLQPSKLTDLLLAKKWVYYRPGKPGYLAYQDRLQSGNLKHKLGRYPDPDTGDWKVKEQVLVTRKGLTNLAKIIAIDAAAKKLAEATSQHQHHLGLDPE